MPSPGFEWLKNVSKSNGTKERIEINDAGDALKKYTNPDGTRQYTVQYGGQGKREYHGTIGGDPLAGFRDVFGS